MDMKNARRGISMRRIDRLVNGSGQIGAILDECKTCRIAMADEGSPYVVPLSFAYRFDGETLTLYFHSAKEGRKIEILRKNPAVCFEISSEGAPVFAPA